MREVTVSRTMQVAPDVAWAVLTDVRRWPDWGPSVRAATIDGGGNRIAAGSTGSVTTAVGVSVPFRITAWVDGRSWRWRVAGIPATSHEVRSIGTDRCEVSFGVPRLAAPYALVCRIALGRIADLLEH